MKSHRLGVVEVPDSDHEAHPYPMWSSLEEAVLTRWYSVLGVTQCAEYWFQLTGRIRSYKQIDSKVTRMGSDNLFPNDWEELFHEGE